MISIGNYSQINSFVVLWPTRIKIGHHTQINPGTAIYGTVEIGNYVMIMVLAIVVFVLVWFNDLTIMYYLNRLFKMA